MNGGRLGFGAARLAFCEGYFARRDLARLGLLALFYLTVCVFGPIFVGRAILHRPLPHFVVIAFFPIAWAGSLYWAARVRTVWRVERLIRHHAGRRARVVDVSALARETRIPTFCVEYVLGAMMLEGSVAKDATRCDARVYRLVGDDERRARGAGVWVPTESHAAPK
ncbi:MAG: hypothetical protein HYY84_03780 [Deltaproteobacteria bacterium]|nr:hypothetical protein [Deltaproteobacteria bacterium]